MSMLSEKPRIHPINFSGPMVRAILAGGKTQTRRIIKPQPLHIEWFEHQTEWCAKVAPEKYELRPCPYGQPGDILYLREALKLGAGGAVGYAADGSTIPGSEWNAKRNKLPPMFMPRARSRVTLVVTGVRVQRLQDISEDDAMAEGVEKCGKNWKSYDCGRFRRSAVSSFESLWSHINGLASWAENPWVWVIEFKPFFGNVDNLLQPETREEVLQAVKHFRGLTA